MISLTRRAFAPIIALVVVAVAAAILWPRGELMYARMPVGLYQSSVPEELASPGGLIAGQKVSVLERRSPWARVSVGRTEGWLPEWYLAERADQTLPAVEKYRQVVKDPCHVYLYPDDTAPAVRELEVGKVATVKAESGDWRYVDIIVFDIPAVTRGWIKVEDLSADGEVAPKEGRIPAGTVVYHGDPSASDPLKLPSEALPYELTITVKHERGDMVWVTAAGGWDAWVVKQDIVFDVMGK